MRFKEKRGQTDVTPFVVYLVLAILVLLTLIFFISSSANGVKIKEQVFAKQIVLLIDSARKDTVISVPKAGFEVTLSGNTITVKGQKSTGYSYEFFSRNKVEIESQENNLIIKIGELK